ncbi:HAMP domain-containing histidine kinase [Vibrio sp. D404a]|uniref:sensor histidine kinase n=1 Tax=unclassified Vibrio TaxID=2614977 RepID=UPI00255309E2|nr:MULTISPECIES: HAMP domain-containing sensor histidine kinase [unclassified Vibrio]MDK9736143.1 HAMP domain-containing histidine kinase [Vibrio sp. D404a]MDK9797360.1 HAMP domain-containing histidine kinase [Vibrio sp. D449a]
MKTFIGQIISSLILGYLVSTMLSLLLLAPYKEQLQQDLNFRRLEMVLNGFLAPLVTNKPEESPVWLFQCDVSSGEMQRVDEGEYTLAKKRGDKAILGTFNSEAYNNDPAIRHIKLVELLEDVLQLLCTLIILILSLRTWTNGFKSLHHLSSQYARGDFKARVDERGPEAVKTLIANQHQMAEAIESLMARQKMIFAALPHDIRTPLSSIQLTSDMLVESHNSDAFLLTKLDEQVRSLNMLCENSLHLLKILNKQVPLAREKANFEAIVHKTFSALSNKKGLELVNCDQTITTDHKVLKILLFNILSNACRYTRENIKIVYANYPNFDVVKISDDGRGFPQPIIQAFNNGDIDSIKPQDGFGIGMLLIYELTTHLNGRTLLSNTDHGGQVTLIMQR